MTPRTSDARRRLLVDALGLGPAWVPRTVAASGSRADVIAGASLESLAACVAVCVECRLATTRTQTVFGVGVSRPDWLVVGEAPGADEDARGEPFVGKAGRLLDAMLAAAGQSRSRTAYIANVIKCRPPGNRDPSADEVEACRPFLLRQIALLEPRLVLVVGRVATQALLGHEGSVAAARGRLHRLDVDGRSVPVVVTYHPAYLLRTPQDKARAWADLCFARRSAAA